MAQNPVSPSPHNQSPIATLQARFQPKKVVFVVLASIVLVGGAFFIGMWLDAEKGPAIAGAIVAAIGQLLGTVLKTSDVERSSATTKDGIALLAEGLKFYGILATLLGLIFAIEV